LSPNAITNCQRLHPHWDAK